MPSKPVLILVDKKRRKERALKVAEEMIKLAADAGMTPIEWLQKQTDESAARER